MKPVMQTKLYSDIGSHHGNCVAACLASILEVPLWMVPSFENMFARRNQYWLDRVGQWVERMFGLEFHSDGVESISEDLVKLPEFYIACGPSPRGVDHAVIHSDGKLVHDPHFSGDGIKAITTIYWMMPTERAKS
jgi:hypothetical protein